MKLTMQELQEKNLQILKAVIQIFDENSIPYIGMFGTLLGTIRHQGQIPWDYDVDIAIPIDYLERCISVLKTKLPSEYWVDFDSTEHIMRTLPRIGLCGYSTKYLHIDIYPIIGIPKNKILRLFFAIKMRMIIAIRCTKEYAYRGRKQVISKIINYCTFFYTPTMLQNRFLKLCKKYPIKKVQFVTCGNTISEIMIEYPKNLYTDVEYRKFENFTIRIPQNYDYVLTALYKDYMQYPPETERNNAMSKSYSVEKI